MIKLHIEGAEYEAVLGSLRTLIEYDVDLIVNLSHNEQALIEIIPILMKIKKYMIFGQNLLMMININNIFNQMKKIGI